MDAIPSTAITTNILIALFPVNKQTLHLTGKFHHREYSARPAPSRRDWHSSIHTETWPRPYSLTCGEIARLHVDQWDAKERIIDCRRLRTASRTRFLCRPAPTSLSRALCRTRTLATPTLLAHDGAGADRAGG